MRDIIRLYETKWYYPDGVGKNKILHYLCSKIKKVRFYRRRAHEKGARTHTRESNPNTNNFRYSRKQSYPEQLNSGNIENK